MCEIINPRHQINYKLLNGALHQDYTYQGDSLSSSRVGVVKPILVFSFHIYYVI